MEKDISKEPAKTSSKKVTKIQNYLLLEIIGKGAFSKVFKGQNIKTNEYVAIKRINKDQLEETIGPNYKDIVQRELSILIMLNSCKNVVQIKDCLNTSQHYYFVFEYLPGGDLAGYLKKRGRISEKQVKNIMKQIANGMKKLNELRIVHRDLKLSNFLITDDSEEPIVKIWDFGFAKQKDNLQESLMYETKCGTWITVQSMLFHFTKQSIDL